MPSGHGSEAASSQGPATALRSHGPAVSRQGPAPSTFSHEVSTAPPAPSAAAAASSQAQDWERRQQEGSRGEALTHLILHAVEDVVLAEELFEAAARHEAAVAILPIGSAAGQWDPPVVPSFTEARLRANGTVWFGSRRLGGRYFLVLDPRPGLGREHAGLHLSLDTWWRAVLHSPVGEIHHVHPLSRTARVDTLEVAEEIWLAHGLELPVPLHQPTLRR